MLLFAVSYATDCRGISVLISRRLDREIEIIHELGQRVLAFEGMLNRLSDILGELDR